MADFIIYAVNTDDIETANQWAQEITGMQTHQRENEYRGDYYNSNIYLEHQFQIYYNVEYNNDDDDYMAFEEYPDIKVILDFSYADLAPDIIQKLDSHPDKFTKLCVKTSLKDR